MAVPSRDSVLSRIRLRHLQCFLAVAQFGNLRRAAEALAISQPAVTKTLNELEQLLGKALFVRGRQGATPTADAELFMRHARTSVSALTEAVDSLRRDAAAAPLRIGVLPTVAPSFMPAVLQPFVMQWPEVPLHIGTGRNTPLLEALRHGELDAVIGRLSDPSLMAGLSFEHLYAEPLVVVLRAGHPLAGAEDAQGWRGLAACPLVLPPRGTLIRQVADSFLHLHGIEPGAGLIETLDTSLSRALAMQGDSVWFTPLGAAWPDLKSGALVRLDAALEPEEAVGLMLRTDAAPSASLQALLAIVRTEGVARVR